MNSSEIRNQINLKLKKIYKPIFTNKELLNFKQVTLKGLASDGGLYVPENWKKPNIKFSNKDITFEKTAYEIIKYFVGESLDNQFLQKLIRKSYESFRNKEITTVKQLDKNNFILEFLSVDARLR